MTNFPTSLDTPTNPTKWDQLNTPGLELWELISNANDALVALQAKVGVDGSAVTTSIDYLVAQLTSRASKQITIASPGASEDRAIFFTPVALTVAKLAAVVRGSGSPSVTWTIRFDPDRSAAGTEVVTGGTVTTNETTGDIVTTFDVAAIPADSWVWLETTAQSGTVGELCVTLIFS